MNRTVLDNQKWIDETWEKIDKKLSKVTLRSREKLPYTTIDGIHNDLKQSNSSWWTNGFWGGMNWLMYVGTGKEEYRKTAERSEEFLDRVLKRYKVLHHDVGFMWHLTSGANYRITGNEESCAKNLFAAATLFSRYNIDGDFIRAWNWGADGYSIIDCLMNIPLLYWASEELEDDRFKKIAVRHMNMALRDHIRQDGSVNHIVDHDIDKVGVKEVLTGQGYAVDSCWSRGLAWAVYGSILSYIHVRDERYLEAAKKTACYFIEHAKQTDYLPLVDFCAPEQPVYYDSTAGVCAACGMIEIAKCVPEEESAYYMEAAVNILKVCDEKCCDYDENTDSLVLMGTERYPHREQDFKGVHIPIIYGDFFFVEALFKLKGKNFLIW